MAPVELDPFEHVAPEEVADLRQTLARQVGEPPLHDALDLDGVDEGIGHIERHQRVP